MLSCYAVEYYIRRNFIFARLLEAEKEKVKNLNKNLESMVNERTEELRNVNEELHKEIAARNISEEERERLEQQLFQAQKMESIGTLAGGIAHDFNNILSSLMGYTELSLRTVEDHSVFKSHLENMYHSEKRAAELVNQILYFTRKSEKKNEPVIPKLILKEVLKFIRSSIPSTIEIRQSIESNSHIMGNATQIHQIFMNLFMNSAQAMDKEGGVLNIKMQDVELEEEDSSLPTLKPGSYIRTEISDTGEGIPPDIINLVFEPYFTTKKVGEGTGLGLAVVHGIIEIYGGHIGIESIVGKGTTFIIHLPITESKIKQRITTDQTVTRGDERILLVDDEPLVAESGRMILSSLGYHVKSMTNSLEALEEFKKNPEAFDLVITDMTMPHMNGVTLAQEISTIRDDLSVIICSGYDKEFSANKENYNGNRSFLNKPFSTLEIAREVRRTLDLRR